MESAEISASSLGIGVAADYEFLASLAFDFNPIARTPAYIAAGRFLGNNAFEAALRRGFEESFSGFRNVVAVASLTQKGQEAFQAFFSIHQRERTEIMAVKGHAIEEKSFHGCCNHASLNIVNAGQVHPRLQLLKARLSPFIECHDLAVDHETVHGEPLERISQLRITFGDQSAVAAVEFDGVTVALRQNTDAVIFNFEKPIGFGKRTLLQGRKHQRLTAGADVMFRRFE